MTLHVTAFFITKNSAQQKQHNLWGENMQKIILQEYRISLLVMLLVYHLGERTKRLFKPPPDVNYNGKYYQNTFISATRAMSDYLLKPRYVLCMQIWTHARADIQGHNVEQ